MDENEIGFVFCVPDFNEVKREGTLSTLILKTIAVLPEFQEFALGNIMLRHIAKNVVANGLAR